MEKTVLQEYKRPGTAYINYGDKVLERFWDYVKVDEQTNCWNWIKCKNKKEYGIFTISTNNTVQAHHFSYQVNKGQIPKNLNIDHLCRNKSCVNPDHLELVTKSENSIRALPFYEHNNQNTNKTICKRGHRLTEDNIYINSNNSRVCKICYIKIQNDYRNKNIKQVRLLDNFRHKLDRKIKKIIREDLMVIFMEVV